MTLPPMHWSRRLLSSSRGNAPSPIESGASCRSRGRAGDRRGTEAYPSASASSTATDFLRMPEEHNCPLPTHTGTADRIVHGLSSPVFPHLPCPRRLVVGSLTPRGPSSQLDCVRLLLSAPTFVPPLNFQVEVNVSVECVFLRGHRPYRPPFPFCVADLQLRPAIEPPRRRPSAPSGLRQCRDALHIPEGQPIHGNGIFSEKNFRHDFIAFARDPARPSGMNTSSERF